MTPDAYFRTHEYMFVFAKGKLKTANLLHDNPNVRPGAKKERKPLLGAPATARLNLSPAGGCIGGYGEARQRMAIPNPEAG